MSRRRSRRAAAATPAEAFHAGRRPLRVCHLAYTFYERDNRVRRYAEALAKRGDDVEVIALRRGGEPVSGVHNGVRITRIQRRQVNEGAAVTYLLKLLMFLGRASALLSLRHLRRPYDVLHLHNIPDFLVFAAWLPKSTGARIILDIHDILPELYRDKFKQGEGAWTIRALYAIERWSVQFADHVIVAGHLWRERLISRAGVAPEHCTAMLNYPDRDVFKPLPAEHRRQDDRFIVIYPGTLNHHQGVDIAVRAFHTVRHRMPGAEFHIYGEGPARHTLTALVDQLQLGACVQLHPPVAVEMMARLIAGADLGVIPKRAEGFGNEAFSTKSLEFMACGVPVVMSRTQVDSGHFNDTIVRFFEPGNPDALAEALLADYTNREERLARAARAAQFVALMDWAVKRPMYFSIVDDGFGAPDLTPALDQ